MGSPGSDKIHEEDRRRSIGRNVEIVMWGLVLLWIGVTAYSTQAGWFPSNYWFQYLIAGLGAIFFVDGLLCYVMDIGQHLVRMVFAAFVLAIVVLDAFNASFVVASAILIAAMGAVLIAYAIIRAKS